MERVPTETVQFLLGNRYCETDRLSDDAWRIFGPTPLGWRRVQAICDFVHAHIAFGYDIQGPTRTAYEAYTDPKGVSRDFAHWPFRYSLLEYSCPILHGLRQRHWLAAALRADGFRCLDGSVARRSMAHVDPRNNCPRIGRVLIAYGRDAADMHLARIFGPGELRGFRVLDRSGDRLIDLIR